MPALRPVASLRAKAREVAVRGTRRAAARLGLDVVRHDFYSPIPEIPPRDDPIWRKEYHLPLDTRRHIEFVEQELGPYLREFHAGLADAEGTGFSVWNGQYQAGDAELLYAMVRHLKPRRILELGSGFSTRVSAAACRANAREGHATELVAVDPEPRTGVAEHLEGIGRLIPADCRDLPADRFERLADGDVLFVDTSHIVRFGGEVPWLILELLPRLAPGVYVHFHDVFLPYEYPWYLLEIEAYFSEQYLLLALLTGSDDWEVVLPAAALARRERDRLLAVIPSLRRDPPDLPGLPYVPAAFWIRRRG